MVAIFLGAVSGALAGQEAGAPKNLLEAVQAGDVSAVREFIKKSAAVREKDGGEVPFLIYAVSSGDDRLLVELLHKADANNRGKTGRTPLQCAVLHHRADMVVQLLEAAADVNAKASHNTQTGSIIGSLDSILDGETALHVAARLGHEDVVDVLMENWADPTLKNADGKTPVDVAKTPALAERLRDPTRRGPERRQKENATSRPVVSASDTAFVLDDGVTIAVVGQMELTPRDSTSVGCSVPWAVVTAMVAVALGGSDPESAVNGINSALNNPESMPTALGPDPNVACFGRWSSFEVTIKNRHISNEEPRWLTYVLLVIPEGKPDEIGGKKGDSLFAVETFRSTLSIRWLTLGDAPWSGGEIQHAPPPRFLRAATQRNLTTSVTLLNREFVLALHANPFVSGSFEKERRACDARSAEALGVGMARTQWCDTLRTELAPFQRALLQELVRVDVKTPKPSASAGARKVVVTNRSGFWISCVQLSDGAILDAKTLNGNLAPNSRWEVACNESQSSQKLSVVRVWIAKPNWLQASHGVQKAWSRSTQAVTTT